MSGSEFIRPKFKASTFTCPRCGYVAHQKWGRMMAEKLAPLSWKDQYCCEASGSFGQHCSTSTTPADISRCDRCWRDSYWEKGELVYPDSTAMPAPNEDLDDDIQADYLEAASVLQKSPRAAAALLRLALQKLCKQLGGKGKNIQQDIDRLVEKGMSRRIAEAMDSVRIVGNDAVHPGQMDNLDDAETAEHMFSLINLIAEKMITEPKREKAAYAALPSAKKRKNLGPRKPRKAD